MADIQYRTTNDVDGEAILELYRCLDWSSVEKPEQLVRGLNNSDSLFTAWCDGKLIGLANAISDGHLVVYYPHVLVHPDFQGQGVGRRLVTSLRDKYRDFHQHSVLADKRAVAFYEQCGFTMSPCAAMWIYDGSDHD